MVVSELAPIADLCAGVRVARSVLKVTVPDAHVAQCALDRDAMLLSRDAIFSQIAERTKLRLRRE